MARNNLVHLVRHGQFDKDGGDGGLTAIGRRQSRRTATRLSEGHIARIYSSDLRRARETAEFIAAKLPGTTATALPMLREMLPTRVPGFHVPLQSRRQAQQRIEKIIGRFLSRPPRSGDIVIVCHGNLIRALLCRILSMPITKWRELGTTHCGITSIGFRSDGRVRLDCYNDTGHLPIELRTSI